MWLNYISMTDLFLTSIYRIWWKFIFGFATIYQSLTLSFINFVSSTLKISYKCCLWQMWINHNAYQYRTLEEHHLWCMFAIHRRTQEISSTMKTKHRHRVYLSNNSNYLVHWVEWKLTFFILKFYTILCQIFPDVRLDV